MLYISIVLVLGTTLVYYLLSKCKQGRNAHRVRLPPGPPRLPLIGNLHLFPRKCPHYQFTEWARQYGDILSLKVMHLDIIVLSSPSAVKELIDKRSSSTSNRPTSIITEMIIPDGTNMGAAKCVNDTWLKMRKAANRMLSPANSDKIKQIQLAEASQLMLEMLRKPQDFYEDISRFTTSASLCAIYGIRGPRSSTHEVKTFVQLQLDFMNVVEIGKSPPVDLFHFLRFFPERLAPWKKRALDVRRRHENLYVQLLQNVKDRLKSGSRNGAFMEDACTNLHEWGLTEAMLINLGGTLLSGSDTTSAVLQNLVMIFVAYPDVLRKAQEEVDAVVGGNIRPPTWSDIQHMPYLRAVLEEVYRFRPVGPLGLPHAMSQDELVNDMILPKNAILFMNLWGIFHDPRYFDDPEKFVPERFIRHPLGVKPDIIDDPARRPNLMFGGGKRICPGAHVARSGIEINAANFVWAFHFTPARDALTGALITPDVWATTQGVNATPLPFKCTIEPRSKEKINIIEQFFRQQSFVREQYEYGISSGDKEYLHQLCLPSKS
ncbi:cytochrome P450 [Suillus placidus]|uniref:Cytochrome P450 n=1 Tax=Suillus placidus TaxID=48579 RepID=A0A9P7A5R1_9AGAM|nr:cytochrome P450 [Suillus placidus]